MKSNRIRFLLVAANVLAAFLLIGKPVDAARIVSIEFRGGGCNMETGTCAGQTYTLSDYLVSVSKDFSKIEGGDSGGCAGGHADGSSCSGQGGAGGGGACSGSGGPDSAGGGSSGHGEDGGTHESESLYDRLPPIHMFLTLENTGQSDLYRFNETITNGTDQYWVGLLMALKQNETGLAMFQHVDDENDLSSNVFTEIYPGEKNQSKKLEWTGGKYPPDNEDLTFAYDILFKDCVDGECMGADSENYSVETPFRYQIMLQSFPLVPAPVPEPATVLLLGIGLISLTGFFRKAKRS